MSSIFSAIGTLISTLFWLAICLLVVVAVVAFFGYNKLRHLSESVKEAWSNVTVVQRKQISLINQLLDVVKGYQESEKLVMLKVSDDVANTAAVAQMYQQSGTVLSTVSGMAQKFPELKANEQYQRLIDSIQGCEHELEAARQQFNQHVKIYNVQRSTIPHVFYSATLGFGVASYLEFSGAEQIADMGTMKSFSSDSDGERLNQLLSVAGSKAMALSGKALENGRILTAKAVEGGIALAETAQEKVRARVERAEQAIAPPPLPLAMHTEPPVPEVLYYFLDADNKPKGPESLLAIQEASASGRLQGDIRVAVVGSQQWIKLVTLTA